MNSSLSQPAGVDRRRCLVQLSALLLAGCGGGGDDANSTIAANSTAVTPVLEATKRASSLPVCLSALVPAYFYQATPWAELATSAGSLVVIANANNGPGRRLDNQYLGWINSVRAAGQRVKGYVYTGYGQRAQASVLADMNRWSDLYGVNDFFIDEAASDKAHLAYYRNLLSAAVAAHAGRRFMLNPGTPPISDYFGLQPDIEILVFEDAWSNYRSTTLPATLDAFAAQCWIMALSASSADMQQAATVARSRRFAGFFATDRAFTDGLPSYWTQEKALARCA